MKIASYPNFIPKRDVKLDVDESIFKKLIMPITDKYVDGSEVFITFHGSAVYDNDGRGISKSNHASDIDGIICCDGSCCSEWIEYRVSSDEITYKGIKDPVNVSFKRIGSDILDHELRSANTHFYASTNLARLSFAVKGEEEFNKYQKSCVGKLFLEGVKKHVPSDIDFITASGAMRMVNYVRLWIDPSRWYSVTSCFDKSKFKERNISVYYKMVDDVLNDLSSEDVIKDSGFRISGEQVFDISMIKRESIDPGMRFARVVDRYTTTARVFGFKQLFKLLLQKDTLEKILIKSKSIALMWNDYMVKRKNLKVENLEDVL